MILDHQSMGTANQGEGKKKKGYYISEAVKSVVPPGWLILSAIFAVGKTVDA